MTSEPDIEAQVLARQLPDTSSCLSVDQKLGQETYPRGPRSRQGGPNESEETAVESLSPDQASEEPEISRKGVTRIDSKTSRVSGRSRVLQAVSNGSKKSKKSKKEHLVPTPLPLSDLEKSIVGWESQEDPKMPLNFSPDRKYWIVGALSLMSLMTPLSSSILAPAIRYINADFNNTDTTLGAMPVSIYLFGYAVGPLFLAPLSEIHGRAIVLTISNVFFCLWHIGCALASSLDALIVFRFLSGVGGSGAMTLGGSIIADIYPIEQRGFALSLWSIGLLMGPSFGPLVGGWRWAPWIVMIPAVICTVMLACLLPETNHRVLIDRKVKSHRMELNRPELTSCYETKESLALSRGVTLKNGLIRPLKILFLSPMVTILSIYVSFVYGTLYLMFNTIPTVFEDEYGWNTGVTGLTFLSLAAGFFIGLITFSIISDRTVVRMTKENSGVFEPEMRLPIMVYYTFITPITFFWYGWAADKHVHWIVPVLGLFPLGFGIIGIWMPAQSYIIDAYPTYAASSLAGFTVLRSITAAFLPLAGPAMFRNLGLGWGNSVLGFICVSMIPVPVLIFRFGARIRKKFPLKF